MSEPYIPICLGQYDHGSATCRNRCSHKVECKEIQASSQEATE